MVDESNSNTLQGDEVVQATDTNLQQQYGNAAGNQQPEHESSGETCRHHQHDPHVMQATLISLGTFTGDSAHNDYFAHAMKRYFDELDDNYANNGTGLPEDDNAPRPLIPFDGMGTADLGLGPEGLSGGAADALLFGDRFLVPTGGQVSINNALFDSEENGSGFRDELSPGFIAAGSNNGSVAGDNTPFGGGGSTGPGTPPTGGGSGPSDPPPTGGGSGPGDPPPTGGGTGSPAVVFSDVRSGAQDTRIPLELGDAVRQLDSVFGFEELVLTGIPDDAILSQGVKNADGTWTLIADEINGTTITQPRGTVRDFVTQIDVFEDNGDIQRFELEIKIPQPDFITGSNRADTIVGTSDHDYIDGGRGRDTLEGGAGQDHIVGGRGNDTLLGGDGNDALFGGRGNDDIRGGDGDDRILYNGGERNGKDTVDGGDGYDSIEGSDQDDTIGLTGISAANSIELIDGGEGNDAITGTCHDDVLDFSTIDVRSIERIDGLQGNDTITGSLAGDVIDGGRGDDVIDGNDGDDVFLIGRANGFDTITGGAGNDAIVGSRNSNVIGLQTFNPSQSVETIRGGSGHDTIQGNDDNNTLDFSATGLESIELIRGRGGDDIITGNDENNTIFGDSGADQIDGGIGNDELSGGSGNDTLNGGFGADRLFGEDDDDIVNGGMGNDFIRGGDGEDILFGDEGEDNIDGNDGNDWIDGGSENDALRGRDGDDNIYGGAGQDSLRGDDGNDRLFGEAGEDDLRGDDGNDTLSGGDGNDHLDGGRGDDILMGNQGQDSLRGGEGNDVIYGDDGLNQNLLVNGSFENNAINGRGWQIFSGIDGWTTDSGLGIEVQQGNVAGQAAEGDALIELDTTANSSMFQDVVTQVGQDYTLNFQYSPRPGKSAATNIIEVLWDGQVVDTITAAGGNATDWSTYTYTLNADANVTQLGFRAGGTSDGLGGYIDNVQLTAVPNDYTNGIHDDTLFGDAGNDQLFGGLGNDTLSGGLDDDYLDGGSGFDTATFSGKLNVYDITYNPTDGSIRVFDSRGNRGDVDTLVNIEQLQFRDATLSASDIVINNTFQPVDTTLGNDINALTITTGTGADTLTLVGDNIFTGFVVDTLAGDDTLTLVGDNNVTRFIVDAGADNDTITLTGAFGDSVIDGGAGDTDTLVLDNDPSQYYITYDATSDSLQINTPNDPTGNIAVSNIELFRFGQYEISKSALTTVDSFSFSAITNTDTLIGGTNNTSWLFGSENNDTLQGGDNQDLLMGGLGEDNLVGGAGNDTLVGGAGNDALFGGAGDDTFVLELDTPFGQDTIDGGIGWVDTVNVLGNITGADPIHDTAWMLRMEDGSALRLDLDSAPNPGEPAFELQNGTLTFTQSDTSGTLTYDDTASAVEFDNIARIQSSEVVQLDNN